MAVGRHRPQMLGRHLEEHSVQKVPYILTVGDREMETGSVSVRTRTGEDLGSMSVEAFAEHLAADVSRRGRSSLSAENENG